MSCFLVHHRSSSCRGEERPADLPRLRGLRNGPHRGGRNDVRATRARKLRGGALDRAGNRARARLPAGLPADGRPGHSGAGRTAVARGAGTVGQEGRKRRGAPFSPPSPTGSWRSPRGSRSVISTRSERSSRVWDPRKSRTSSSRAPRGIGTVGAGIGAAAMLPIPPAMPAELAAEVVGVATIEIKLIAELHEVYGRGPPAAPAARDGLSDVLDRGTRHRDRQPRVAEHRARQADEAANCASRS